MPQVRVIYFYKSRDEWAMKPERNFGCESNTPLRFVEIALWRPRLSSYVSFFISSFLYGTCSDV